MRADPAGCRACHLALPEYVDAVLRGASAPALYPEVFRHLTRCGACASLIAEVVSVTRWREAAEPFNPVAHAPRRGRTGDCPGVH